MDNMIKIVDTTTGIVIAYLESDGVDMLGIMAMARVIGKHYGCDEVQVSGQVFVRPAFSTTIRL